MVHAPGFGIKPAKTLIPSCQPPARPKNLSSRAARYPENSCVQGSNELYSNLPPPNMQVYSQPVQSAQGGRSSSYPEDKCVQGAYSPMVDTMTWNEPTQNEYTQRSVRYPQHAGVQDINGPTTNQYYSSVSLHSEDKFEGPSDLQILKSIFWSAIGF
jgi:hypothetical protein